MPTLKFYEAFRPGVKYMNVQLEGKEVMSNIQKKQMGHGASHTNLDTCRIK